MTVNLENGKAVKEKLRNESIFVNRVTEGIYETRIAMPDVKVGSVIDLEFRFQGIPAEWRFQEEIPVRYSELVFENSPYVKFTSNFFGLNHWHLPHQPVGLPKICPHSRMNLLLIQMRTT